jgi:uncharacterized protein YxeA
MDKGYLLYNAVKAGEIETVRKMISEDADVNYVFCPDEYAYTPLHMAAYFAMDEIIELLINNGADVNSFSMEGKTPLVLAEERHNRETTKYLLLNHGAIDGTAPIPDYAPVGDVFLTTDDHYLLIVENGKIKEYDKSKLQDLMEERKNLSSLGEEVAISFDNDIQSKTSVYYGFSLKDKSVETVKEEKKTIKDSANEILQECSQQTLAAKAGCRRHHR